MLRVVIGLLLTSHSHNFHLFTIQVGLPFIYTPTAYHSHYSPFTHQAITYLSHIKPLSFTPQAITYLSHIKLLLTFYTSSHYLPFTHKAITYLSHIKPSLTFHTFIHQAITYLSYIIHVLSRTTQLTAHVIHLLLTYTHTQLLAHRLTHIHTHKNPNMHTYIHTHALTRLPARA